MTDGNESPGWAAKGLPESVRHHAVTNYTHQASARFRLLQASHRRAPRPFGCSALFREMKPRRLSVLFIWSGAGKADSAASFIESLESFVPAATVFAALGPNEASLELDLESSRYGRSALGRLKARATRAGAQFVLLPGAGASKSGPRRIGPLAVPTTSREALRKRLLGAPAKAVASANFHAIAQAVRVHLNSLLTTQAE